jgi:hypothetical protein
MAGTLKCFEMSSATGNPLQGLTVKLYAASDTQPNTGTVLQTTTTDLNGIWSFSVADGDYDVQVSAPGINQVKWYKGNVSMGIASLSGSASVNASVVSLLSNGDCQVNQQAANNYTSSVSRNNDGAMTLDDVWLLSDGNNIVNVGAEVTDVPTGARGSLKLVTTTINKKAGVVQYLTNEQMAHILETGVASISFQAHTTAAKVVNKLRAALIGWSGTADAFTRDCVNTTNWGAQGVNPTLATSWAYLSTPVDLALTTAYQVFKVENIAVASSNKNAGLFIWVDDTDMALNDEVFIANMHVEASAVCHAHRRRSFGEALRQCQERWQKSYAYATVPGSATITGSIETAGSSDNLSKLLYALASLKVTMRASPSLTYYDLVGNVSKITVIDVSGTETDGVTPFSMSATDTIVRGVHSGATNSMHYHYIVDARPGV